MCNFERCNSCTIKTEGCKKTCEKYILYEKAYDRAMEIIKDHSLSVPSYECKGCKERKELCHSTCWSYTLATAYKSILKEIIKKEKIKHSVNHLTGIPGLPAHAKYDKSQHTGYRIRKV